MAARNVRPFRLAVFGFVAAILLAPTFASLAIAGQKLQVDEPTPNRVIANGDIVNIGGWTTGTRVDVYLDGPSGVGRGLGSTEVSKARPDVMGVTGKLNSGFDLPWAPMGELTDGPHTLYVYALDNGVWLLEMVPVIGEGNLLPPARDDRGMDY